MVDKMILQILGTDTRISNILNKLKVPHIGNEPGLTVQAETKSGQANEVSNLKQEGAKKRKLPFNESADESEIEHLKKQEEKNTVLPKKSVVDSEMYRLKRELIRVEIYKNKLKILKLETELGLQPSEHTKSIVNANDTNVEIKWEQQEC